MISLEDNSRMLKSSSFTVDNTVDCTKSAKSERNKLQITLLLVGYLFGYLDVGYFFKLWVVVGWSGFLVV